MTKRKDHRSFTHLFTRFTLIKEIRLHGRFTSFTTIKNRPGHSFTQPFTVLHAPQLHALLHVLLHAASRENENPRSQLHASFTQELHAPPSPTEREGVRTRNTTPNSHPSRCRAHPVTAARAHIRGEIHMSQVRLTCLTPEAAAAVVDEHADYFGAGASNTVEQDGPVVVIDYFDKRWPLDIAEWAGEQGHASDSAAASVITQL